MFGIRFTSLIRKSSQLCLNTVVLPKFQFAMANKYFIHYRQINNKHLAENITSPNEYYNQKFVINDGENG